MTDFGPTYLSDVATGATTEFETRRSLESGDTSAFQAGMNEQAKQVGIAAMQIAARGGDPIRETTALGAAADWRPKMQLFLAETYRRTKELDAALEQGGYGDIQKWFEGVAERYRAQNESRLIRKPTNEQEWLQQVQQNQPVFVDPNEVANVRQMAVRLDQQMRAVDPSFSFWTHPKTAKIAQWLNREAGGGQVGFFTSGDQRLELGAVGTAAMAGAELVSGAADFGLNLVHGAWDLSDQALRALGGDGIGPLTPTNYIEGPDGQLYTNAAKAPDWLDSMTMLWASATGRNIEQAVAEMGRTRELELASRNGFQTIALGGSRILGMGFGFGLPAGMAMNAGAKSFGALGQRGLTWLGSLGMKGVASERAVKLTRLLAGTAGAAVGNGVAESVAFGRQESYGGAFLHGMAMAPVLLTLGALGKRTEWFAEHRLKMPKRVAAQVGAAMEGVGFGAMEAGTLPFLPAAWDLIRNPSEETWETYAKNIAGFMLFKAASRGRSVNPATEALALAQLQARRGEARARFAERVARGEVDPAEIEQVAMQTGIPADRLQELGRASEAARLAKTPEERQAALERRQQIEAELDVAELGLKPPAERELEALEPEGTGQEELMRQADERIRRTQAEIQGMTPEEIAEWGRTMKDRPVDPEVAAEEAAREAQREAERRTQAVDPLEDPRFLELAEDVRERILAAPDADARRAIMAEVAPERRVTPIEPGAGAPAERPAGPGRPRGNWRQEVADLSRARRPREEPEPEPEPEPAGERGELEVRQIGRFPSRGERSGPQSLQQPPTRQLQPSGGVEPVRAVDIYREMEGRPGRKGFRIPFTAKRIGGDPGDVVRVPMAGGRIGSRGVLGVFKFFENMVRTKEGRDLVAASHEWSHAMHRHMLGVAGRALPLTAKEQMLAAIAADPRIEKEIDIVLKDYPGSDTMHPAIRWMETWAEWHARNLLGEVGLDQKLPALSAWMRRWLAEPQQAAMRQQYERIQSMLDRYNRQGSYLRERMSMVLGTDEPSPTEKALKPSAWDRFKEQVNLALFDDMARLKASQEKWLRATGRSPEDLNIMDDPARVFDALRMTAGKTAEYYIRNGFRETGVVGLEPIMKELKGREEEFAVYVSAVRNAQLYKRGKKSTLPIADHLENIRVLQRQYPDFRTHARALKRWTDGLIDYVARSGNLDPAAAQRIKDAYVVYVPFFRAIEGPRAHAQARGVAESGTGLKRIHGSTYEIRDPLVALQDVARQLIAKAHQNHVMAALYKMAVGYEAGGIATVVPKKNIPKEHPLREILDAMERGVDFRGDAQHGFESILDALRDANALDPQTITLFTEKVIPVGERNIIAFTPRLRSDEISRIAMDRSHEKLIDSQQGEVQWLEIHEPKVYEALMGIDQMPHMPPALQPFMRWLRGPRDLVRFFATGVSPGFAAANLIRDALSYPIFAQDGKVRPFGGIVRLIQGAIEYHKGGEFRQLYEELGVKTSSFFTEGEKRELVGQREQKALKRGYQKLLHWADQTQQFFSHPENYLRMAEFKQAYLKAKAEGKSETEARFLALEAGREITVNFARAGIMSRVLNQTIPYFNAGMQGKRKLWGQLLWGGDAKSDAAKARVQRAAVLNGIANITVPSIALWLMNREEDWYQDLPEWRKTGYWNMKIGDDIVSIPKPFEAGVLFGSLPEALLERAFDEGGNPAGLSQLARDTLGVYTEGIGSLIPAALKPILEVSWNWNSFSGRPLTPDWIERGSVESEQATFYTTETAKVVSRAVNGVLTPIEIEQMLGGYTAGAATSAMKAMDELVGVKSHPVSVQPWARFTRQAVHGQSRYVDQLYELSVDLDQLHGSGRLSGDDLRLRSRVETAKRQISELRKSFREGAISRAESEERAYELARPLVEEWNQ